MPRHVLHHAVHASHVASCLTCRIMLLMSLTSFIYKEGPHLGAPYGLTPALQSRHALPALMNKSIIIKINISEYIYIYI